jgi:hypothetical protein
VRILNLFDEFNRYPFSGFGYDIHELRTVFILYPECQESITFKFEISVKVFKNAYPNVSKLISCSLTFVSGIETRPEYAFVCCRVT